MSDTWTIQRILAWIEEYLGQHGDEHPRTSSQWLVSEALGLSRMQLFLDLERPLSEDERAILRDYTKRRAAGEPLQYITGEAPFRYITVKVAPGVLIPRPETEVLVSVALSLLPKAAKPQDALDEEILRKYAELTAGEEGSFSKEGEPDARNEHESHERLDELEETEGLDAPGQHPMIPTKIDSPYLVADICTGTGCIACSIASERNDVRVIATDIAKDAITLADENIQRLELSSRVTTRCCDLGDGIAPELIGAFDLVVSNPPYIPTEVLGEIPSEVSQYEPKLALDGGTDGLDVYRKLLDFCAQALKSGGGFAIELHETTLDAAVQLASEHNFIDIEMTRDLNEKPRVISARKR